jgi:hypothetical protein
MKALAALVGIVFVLAVSGCTQQAITCESPYTVKGSNCCLDQNANKVCDVDEAGGQPDDLVKNYGPYEVRMYITQESPEPDSWNKLPANPPRHYERYQIFNYPQDSRYFDGGWLILYTGYNEETITCSLNESHDSALFMQDSVRLTRKGFSGNVTGVTIRALFDAQNTPKEVLYQISCKGDESGITFSDAYDVVLRPP